MLLKIFLLVFSLSFLFAEEDTKKVSETVGHLIGKNLEQLGLELDIQALLKGLADEASGKEAPISEKECMDALAKLQEKSLEKISKKNLDEANAFLEKNKKKKGVVSLEKGKIQYEIVQPGKGESLKEHHCPMVHIEEKLLNKEIHGKMEEILFLEDTLEGLKEGLLGMKEGEKRTLYIHPDFGYGKESRLAPNALLIVEVEILKLDASGEAHAASEREGENVLPAKSLEETKTLPQ